MTSLWPHYTLMTFSGDSSPIAFPVHHGTPVFHVLGLLRHWVIGDAIVVWCNVYYSWVIVGWCNNAVVSVCISVLCNLIEWCNIVVYYIMQLSYTAMVSMLLCNNGMMSSLWCVITVSIISVISDLVFQLRNLLLFLFHLLFRYNWRSNSEQSIRGWN